MNINIIAVGSNKVIAEEVRSIVSRIIGTEKNIIPMVTTMVTGQEKTDLYVCAITQKEPLLKKISPEKLNILDLRPTAQFFIDISHIPAGEKVYIFNSNIHYAQLLKQMCETLHIKDLEFIAIAYEDMPFSEVIEKLQKASYIIGVGKLVSDEVLLSEKYLPHLKNDVTIIGRTRMATMQTACALIQQANAICNRRAAKRIAALAEQLRSISLSGENAVKYHKIVNEIENLISEKSSHNLPIQTNLINSFAAQFSGKLTSSDKTAVIGDSAETDIANTLQKIGEINVTR